MIAARSVSEQVGGHVDVVVEGRLPTRLHASAAYSASRWNVSWCVSVKRSANSRFSALAGHRAGETRTERANVFVVEAVAVAQVVCDLLHELVRYPLCAHDASVRPVRTSLRAGASSLRRMLEIGENAPDFTLPDQDGNDVTLSDLKGQTVVLYFYPKADTPGCTTQACGIRDHLPDYDARPACACSASRPTR